MASPVVMIYKYLLSWIRVHKFFTETRVFQPCVLPLALVFIAIAWSHNIAYGLPGTSQATRVTSSKPTATKSASLPPELQSLIDAERTATNARDTAAVINSCRSVIAFALSQLAESRSQEGDHAEAAHLYKSSLATEPAPATQLNLASELIASGDVVEAKSLANEVLDTDPENLRARSLSTGLLAQNHSQTKVQSAPSLAVEGQLRRILAVAYNDWGTAVVQQNEDYAGAFLLFQASTHWDPSTPGAVRNLGLAAFRLGKFEDSQAAFQAIVGVQPADEQAHLLLGLSLFSLKQFAEAAKAFAPVAGAVMQNSHAAYAWAFSLAHVPEPQQANHILDQLSERPLPPDEMALVCQVYEQTENYEHAITCLRKVNAEAPALKKVHYGIGVSLIHLSRPAEAVPELREELALTPNEAEVQFAYAYALIATSQKPEAQTVLTSVVEEQPSNGPAQYELGKLLAEQQQWQSAITHLQAAAVAQPDNYDVHYQLQNAYRKNGQNAEAARELEIYKTIKANVRSK